MWGLALAAERLHLQDLWQDHYHCDVSFEVEGQRVHAHRVVLSCSKHTPYFKGLLQSGTREGGTGVIPIHGVSHSCFTTILKFLYTNEADITREDAPELIKAAAPYLLKPLQLVCIRVLVQSLCPASVWAALPVALLEHCLPAEAGDSGEPIPQEVLQQACVRFLLKHAVEVVATSEFHQQREQLAPAMVEVIRQALAS